MIGSEQCFRLIGLDDNIQEVGAVHAAIDLLVGDIDGLIGLEILDLHFLDDDAAGADGADDCDDSGNHQHRSGLRERGGTKTLEDCAISIVNVRDLKRLARLQRKQSKRGGQEED